LISLFSETDFAAPLDNGIDRRGSRAARCSTSDIGAVWRRADTIVSTHTNVQSTGLQKSRVIDGNDHHPEEPMMMDTQKLACATAARPSRMGERWHARAARAVMVAPPTAASIVQSAWCRPDRWGVWTLTLDFRGEADALGELQSRAGATCLGEA
jgi:hypothetical protein